jgi:CRISPR-associated endonuclease/helicase Cas3
VAQACAGLSEVLLQHVSNAMHIDSLAQVWFTVLAWFGWTHDLGKANSQYMSLLGRHDLRMVNLLRHEKVSGLLLGLEPNLKEWSGRLPSEEQRQLLACIVGHHRKAGIARDSPPMTVWINHSDWMAQLNAMAAELGLEPPRSNSRPIVLDADEAPELLDEMEYSLERSFSRTTPAELSLSAALRATSICADVIGSAWPEEKRMDEMNDYVRAALREHVLRKEDIEHLLSVWRGGMEHSFLPRSFQLETAKSRSNVTLLEAGCGSGKSVAAYMWLMERCGEAGRKGFLCMPTMGTSTEQFADYALPADVGARLVHSKADIDLAYLERQLPENEEEGESAASQKDEIAEVSRSFELWRTPLVICTADTVLGLMVNQFRSLLLFPAIVNSAIVFDEIHAYPPRMFGMLLAFLKVFPGLPVLLMTASLTESRKRLLQEVCPHLEVIKGPAELERLERYRIRRGTSEEAVQAVRQELSQGARKVLWVCNTVERACSVYRKLRDQFPEADVLLYHSRYQYNHRAALHRHVIGRFRENSETPCILVATQVAEMSLDLSAEVLVSDLAPAPALIQRMGRLNRKATPERCVPMPAWIVDVDIAAPYTQHEIQYAIEWLDALELSDHKSYSQANLKEALNQVPEQENVTVAQAEREAIWYSRPWEAASSSVRDASQTVYVVRESEYERYRTREGRDPNRAWVKEHEIPMTLAKDTDVRQCKLCSGAFVVPDAWMSYSFDEQRLCGEGGAWRKQSSSD